MSHERQLGRAAAMSNESGARSVRSTQIEDSMERELEAAVRIGDVLATKYRVERVLGAGGMGVVVAATHLQLDQRVALKLVRTEALHHPEIIARFEREARVAVRLKSEHSARIIDVGRLESGSPYIVMEYLEGQDLAQLLEQRGSLSIAVACDYVIQACDAIAEAHGLGIVHRDLKPGNLFLAKTSHGQEVIKVLDFGISKTYWPAGDLNVTRTQAVIGSPGYMSPEQMRSTKNVDGRSDIWSLGVILYELVAGRIPFEADTFSALCVKIAVDPHPPMLELPAKLPAGFEAAVNRALEKDPTMRYRSVAELAQALALYAGPSAQERANRLASASPGVMSSADRQVILGPHANTIDAAPGQISNPRPSRSRSLTMMIAGAGIVAAAAMGVSIGLMCTGSGGGGNGTTAEESNMAPDSALLRAAAPPVQSEAQARSNADGTSSDSVATPPTGTASASVSLPIASPGPPPGTRPDAGSIVVPPDAASPAAMSRPKLKPTTIDPYSSPD
jgi:eukaryotic-like serine/threonine-protein kinase